jgi:hypothetical protein
MADRPHGPPRGRPLVAVTAVLASVLLLAPQPARGEPLALPIVSALPLPSILPSPLQSTLTELISPAASLIAPVESPLSSAVTQLVSPVASLVAPVQSILPLPPLPTLAPVVPTLPTATLPPVVPTATLPPILPTALPPLPTATGLPTATAPLPPILPSAASSPSPSPAATVAGATLAAGPVLVVPPGGPPAAPFPPIGGPLGDLVRLLSDVSVPALTAGVPTLLVIAFIAAQVLGGAAWTTLVRRGLGSWGLRVLRPAGSPEEVGGPPREG